MNLVSALSHAVELFIVFQFFNDLFANKGRKTVAAAVGIASMPCICGVFAV